MLKQTASGLALSIVVATAAARADDPPPPTAPPNNVLVIPGPATPPPAQPPPPSTPPVPPTAPVPQTPPQYWNDPRPPQPTYQPQYREPRYVEPMPPPLPPHHRAPRTALWVGVRGGYEAPFGNAVAGPTTSTYKERAFVGPGPTLEFDIGGRFGRDFMPFAFVQVASPKSGNGALVPEVQNPNGSIDAARSAQVTSSSATVFGFGLRYAFNPDSVVGFAAEIDWAYRKTTASFADGTKYRATGPGVIRLGLGADVRINEMLVIDPMFVASAGSYSDVTLQPAGGTEVSIAGTPDTFAYLGFQIGAHVDLFGRQ